ncbi:hypothetical protein VNO77_19964 [Canavalia gladiata]|uniref:Uncharacterized protein n=1 Tax=Canavalia gladiata TaxID=3824 RepID=A0AAN9QLY6_CANGL
MQGTWLVGSLHLDFSSRPLQRPLVRVSSTSSRSKIDQRVLGLSSSLGPHAYDFDILPWLPPSRPDLSVSFDVADPFWFNSPVTRARTLPPTGFVGLPFSFSDSNIDQSRSESQVIERFSNAGVGPFELSTMIP